MNHHPVVSPSTVVGPFLAPAEEPSVARVLIADDDAETLEWMCDTLQGPHLQVTAASSGAELVRLLAERGPFHLVVADVRMPWIDGLSVIRSARAACWEAPVLFVTGLPRSDLAASVLGLGNARLLHKPVGVESLRAAVRELLHPAPVS